MLNWIDVHEPGKPEINRNLLFRIDPGRGLIEVVRRRVRTIVDLADFFDNLEPKLPDGEGGKTTMELLLDRHPVKQTREDMLKC